MALGVDVLINGGIHNVLKSPAIRRCEVARPDEGDAGTGYALRVGVVPDSFVFLALVGLGKTKVLPVANNASRREVKLIADALNS